MKALLDLPRFGQRERIAFKASHTGTPRYIRYLDEVETEVRTSVISRTGQRSHHTKRASVYLNLRVSR